MKSLQIYAFGSRQIAQSQLAFGSVQAYPDRRIFEWTIGEKNGQIGQLSRGSEKNTEKAGKPKKQGKYRIGNGTGDSWKILRENEEL